MAPEEPQASTASAKDIDSLFSRAGLTGAAYRKFPRSAPGGVVSGDHQPPGSFADTHGAPALRASSPVAATRSIPITQSSAPHPTTIPTNPEAAPQVAHWTSLERFFAAGSGETPPAAAPLPSGLRLAIVSLAGGVGKTTLAVTLARLLSGQHRQVLIADGGLLPTIPLHFASRSQRLGALEFLYPPAGLATMPIGMFRLSLAGLNQQTFLEVLRQVESSESLLLIDYPTLQSAASAELLATVDHLLVPLTPDVHSIAALAHWQQLVAASVGDPLRVRYILNRFEASRPLHREIQTRLRKLLGEALLDIAIAEDSTFPEAAASGATVVDYRPGCAAVTQLGALAEWLSHLPATASTPAPQQAAGR